MDLDDATGTQERFRAYAADLASVLGHADRVRPFEDDCTGLLSAEGRKSVEPLPAVTAPEKPTVVPDPNAMPFRSMLSPAPNPATVPVTAAPASSTSVPPPATCSSS